MTLIVLLRYSWQNEYLNEFMLHQRHDLSLMEHVTCKDQLLLGSPASAAGLTVAISSTSTKALAFASSALLAATGECTQMVVGAIQEIVVDKLDISIIRLCKAGLQIGDIRLFDQHTHLESLLQ